MKAKCSLQIAFPIIEMSFTIESKCDPMLGEGFADLNQYFTLSPGLFSQNYG